MGLSDRMSSYKSVNTRTRKVAEVMDLSSSELWTIFAGFSLGVPLVAGLWNHWDEVHKR